MQQFHARLAGALTTLAMLLVGATTSADAQILKKIKKRAKSAAESEVLRKVDQEVREGVRCTFDDSECIDRAKKGGDAVVLVDDSGEVVEDDQGNAITDPKAAAAKAAVKPGEGAWANYDFVPGDDVLFADDFSADNVGDFPRRFDLIQGNFEIIEWQGQRLLRGTSNGSFALPLPKTLPERFTIEFDARVSHGNAWIRATSAPYFYGPRRGEFKGNALSLQYSSAGLLPVTTGPKVDAGYNRKLADEMLLPVRITADAKYIKMYLGENRVANAPNAVFPRSDTLYIGVGWASDKNPILIGPIRIAGGGRDLYDRLERDGRVATQGILFSTGSDRIRPESTPTLKEIAAALTEHPELRLRIEGHTDNVGDDGSNLDLSKRRAASVQRWLVDEAGIDGARLESQGLGEQKPATTNDSPEGRQQNRRVELVKLGR